MKRFATRAAPIPFRAPYWDQPGRLRLVLLLCASTALAVFASSGLSAQSEADSGRIVGRVMDAETGRGLVGARVTVRGTSVGTLSGIDGRYVLTGVPLGSVAMTASYLGYGDKIVTDIEVAASGAVKLDLSLAPSAVAIDGVTVTVSGERGTVSRALDEQRVAVGVISSVTSEEISRSPDGDAAAAIQRVTGVSVQDGKYISVRGLGERYTTTSLNGARIPSPDPEKKMVPLDLFPSGLLQSITTSKTFTPNLPGDFSGAQVDIRTREFPANREITYSYSAGYNAGVTGTKVTAAPAEGGEWLALATAPRQIPGVLRNWTSFDGIRQQDYNAIVRSFRNTWSTEQQTAIPSTSMSASVGGTDPVFGRSIGYLASVTYSMDQDARLDQIRAVALPGSDGGTLEASRYEGTTGRTSVLWGGLLNLSTMFGPSNRISLNANYSRSADNEGRRETGVDENTGADLRIDRLQYVERGVFSGQLRGKHQLGKRQRADWSLGTSSVSREEPDRSEVVYLMERNSAGEELPAAWALSGNEVAVRTFADLTETAHEGSVNYRLSFGNPNRPFDLLLGALGRKTQRDADNRAWSVQAIGSNPLTRDRALREQAPEAIFGDTYTDPSDNVFSVVPIAQGGSYRASEQLYAGYAMLDWMLSDRLELVAGARLEHTSLELDALSTDRKEYSAAPSYTDVLPAITLNFGITENQKVRLSASQTLARPEYREIAPIQYRDVIGGENTRGNADLGRTLIQNLDLRWEFYPELDETLSVALFAKRFRDPIERIYLATSGTAINTFVNAVGARNYGVEVEARKGLGMLGRGFDPLSVFANATLMQSEIEIGNEGLASTTNPHRPMLGQAPYVLNAGIAYADRSGLSATLLYNLVGKRIVAAAGAPLPDVYAMPMPSLDLSLRFPILGNLAGKLDAQNLLDSAYRVEQGSVVREYYRTGRSFSMGVTLRR